MTDYLLPWKAMTPRKGKTRPVVPPGFPLTSPGLELSVLRAQSRGKAIAEATAKYGINGELPARLRAEIDHAYPAPLYENGITVVDQEISPAGGPVSARVYDDRLPGFTFTVSVTPQGNLVQLQMSCAESERITTTALRKVRADAMVLLVRRAAGEHAATYAEALSNTGSDTFHVERYRRIAKDLSQRTQRGPSADKDHTRYAVLAARYVELCNDPAHYASPVKRLAEEMHVSSKRIGNLLAIARDHDLLTKAPIPRRPGGELTDKARQLLEEGRD